MWKKCYLLKREAYNENFILSIEIQNCFIQLDTSLFYDRTVIETF
jgi:hypothetical protein